MSHTVKVKVSYSSLAALSKAVEAMGGKVLGDGTHKLFDAAHAGFGFTLKGWNYPLVLKADGELAFDDYGGQWGNRADLDRLRGEYALARAEEHCAQVGWQCERASEGVRVYHPDGGTFLVTADGVVDASNFTGPNCVEAAAPLEEALGKATDRNYKAEFYAQREVVRVNA